MWCGYEPGSLRDLPIRQTDDERSRKCVSFLHDVKDRSCVPEISTAARVAVLGLRMPDKDFSHRLLVDKLSVKPGMRVAAIGIADTAFLEERTPDVSTRLRGDCDVILLGVEKTAGLTRIEGCIPSMKP